jgi:hypothetical protein
LGQHEQRLFQCVNGEVFTERDEVVAEILSHHNLNVVIHDSGDSLETEKQMAAMSVPLSPGHAMCTVF